MTSHTSDLEYGVLSGRRALITGAAGFIGRHLTNLLASHGAAVHATVRQRRTDLDGVQQFHQLELTDLDAVRRLITEVRPEYVFHLAAVTSAARAIEAVIPTFQSNVVSTVNLLTSISQDSECRRIVLAGSLEEPLKPELETASSPYAASKLTCSIYARMFHSLYNTPITLARIFMVYGPAQADIKKLIPYVTLSLLQGKAPKLSSGTRLVDWVYVEDVADALLRCAIRPGLEGKTVDIGSGQLTTVRDVAQQLSELINGGSSPVFGTIPDRAHEQVHAADIESTRQLLGQAPQTPLTEGLRRTIDWYRGQLATGSISSD